MSRSLKTGKKATAEFCKAVEALGWFPHRFTKSGHLQMRHTSGALYVISMTPSDHRSTKNALAAMRRVAKENPQD